MKTILHHISQEPRKKQQDQLPPALVLLHGVRSNEHDLIGLAPRLDPRFHVISAQAPLPMGPGAYGWYEVDFLPGGRFRINEEEAEHSRQMVTQFVEEVKASYPVDPARVFLMGFSQGCIMSLGAALTNPKSVAGVVGMSGRLLESTMAHLAPVEDLRGLPVMVVHGTQDQVIRIEEGREIRDTLSKLPVNLTYQEYPMGHQVSAESLAEISKWLTAVAFGE